MKTDGSLYKILLRIASDEETDHNVYAFIEDTSNQWKTFEIPLANFLLEKKVKHEEIVNQVILCDIIGSNRRAKRI